MAIVRDAIDTSALTGRLVVDMSSGISLLSPTETPILTLLTKKGKKETKNPRFDWLEDDIGARWDSIVTDYTATVTVLNVEHAAYFSIRDLVQVVRTGELMLVTDVDVTDGTITVQRGWGSVAPSDIVADDPVQIIGNVNEEGAAAREALINTPTGNYNYTQIFRTTINITSTARNSSTWDGSDLAYMRYKAGLEHALDIERAFIFGERQEDITGTHPKRTTAGLLSVISTNRLDAGGALTEANFNSYLADIFAYGSNTKYLFCSGKLISIIASWARGLLTTRPTDTVTGIAITEYISAHGKLLLVPHRLLRGSTYDSYGIFADLDELTYRYLTGRDTKLYTNIQSPGYDGEIDEYLTEAGLEIRSETKHGVIYNF